MRVLFLHQNMPGQFRHIVGRLAREPEHQLVFATRRSGVRIPGVKVALYKPQRERRKDQHPYLRTLEDAVLHGQQVARMCIGLKKAGFVPDLVVVHPGWGEGLFAKDVFPSTAVLNYCEYFYTSDGGDMGYDPSLPPTIDDRCRLRLKNAHLLAALEACDHGWSPTQWQRSRHPEVYQGKISVVHEGIDTTLARPSLTAKFPLPTGRMLTHTDEVITYVARNFEPHRGFPTFIRALPDLLARRPSAQIVIVGGDKVSYGARAVNERTWREVLTEEVSFDPSRVHFIKPLPYREYISLLQISTVHVYLTAPFVLSWSFLEAMSVGCVVVGSRTAPVEEVLRDGENGFLTELLSPEAVAADVAAAVVHPERDQIRTEARNTILARFALQDCLPTQLALIEAVAEGRAAPVSIGAPGMASVMTPSAPSLGRVLPC